MISGTRSPISAEATDRPFRAELDGPRRACINQTGLGRDGRVAQRESTPFTREGSQVQSLSRPPLDHLDNPREFSGGRLASALFAHEMAQETNAPCRKAVICC